MSFSQWGAIEISLPLPFFFVSSNSSAWHAVQNNIYHGLALIRERDRVSRRVKRVHDAATIQQSVGLDLSKLHRMLFSLERELASLTSAGRLPIARLKQSKQAYDTCAHVFFSRQNNSRKFDQTSRNLTCFFDTTRIAKN